MSEHRALHLPPPPFFPLLSSMIPRARLHLCCIFKTRPVGLFRISRARHIDWSGENFTFLIFLLGGFIIFTAPFVFDYLGTTLEVELLSLIHI